MSDAHHFTPEERLAVAGRVLELLRGDPRVHAAELIGSLAAGTAHEYSDVDVAVSVRDDADLREVAGDWVRRMYDELPVVHHFEVEFAEPVRGFLLEGLLEVDLGFTHLPPGELPVETPAANVHALQAGFFWHDVLHAVSAVHRGRRWRALYYLESLRTRILVVAATERGLRTTELKGADDLPESLLDELRTTLVASVEPDELLRALRAATRIFLEQIRGAEPSLLDRLEPQLSALLE